tara:strand:- start:574 stop:924 length:351 start_codon:yes stop_codon:yes gene_type:complete
MIWDRIYTSPHNNHLFVNTCDREYTYICDNSGPDPEHTDDGPIMFAHTICSKIVVKPSRFGGGLVADVPVIAEREESSYSRYSAGVDINGALLLGQRHNIDVVMENVLYTANKEDA